MMHVANPNNHIAQCKANPETESLGQRATPSKYWLLE